MPLYHLLYQSYASEEFTGRELPTLLRQSSLVNQAVEVTGLLLYTPDGRFAQLLEGRKQHVLEVYERIVRDSRNHTCEVLMEGPWSKRSFSYWCVGLSDCAVVPEGLPLTCVNFRQLPDLLTKVAPTRPMLVHRLLSFVEPFLTNPTY
ncbi:BLUF domain-containing protein [Hymenobacter rigui]|nr:BLUF domain-containing protein [Hymenobacter rigui]